MKVKELEDILVEQKHLVDGVRSKRSAGPRTFEVWKSYFYHHGMTDFILWNRVEEALRALNITTNYVGSGDHGHSFVGGAPSGSAKDSYLWVRFQVID